MFVVVDSWDFLSRRDHLVGSCVALLSCYNFVTSFDDMLEDGHTPLVDVHPVELALTAEIFYNHHL